MTDSEPDLLTRMERAYQLEIDSLGGSPLLRPKDNEVLRPADTNASTLKALQYLGLIQPEKGRDPAHPRVASG